MNDQGLGGGGGGGGRYKYSDHDSLHLEGFAEILLSNLRPGT